MAPTYFVVAAWSDVSPGDAFAAVAASFAAVAASFAAVVPERER